MNAPVKMTPASALAVSEFLIECGATDAPIWEDLQSRCPHIAYEATEFGNFCVVCAQNQDAA